jgi:hypothetical protein
VKALQQNFVSAARLLGTVPGEADVAILDADPLADVGKTASQVFGVLANGVLRTAADLTAAAPKP